eukprot:3941620-Rhodomonas_salina.4
MGCAVLTSRIALCALYGMSGTELAYAGTGSRHTPRPTAPQTLPGRPRYDPTRLLAYGVLPSYG